MAEPLQSVRARVDALYAADRAAQALGIAILDAAPGRVRASMTVRSDMLNGHEICHGGLLFTFADTAFAYACNSHGVAMVAAGANIEFMAPAFLGERLIASAVETSRTDRQGLYDVVVANESGETRAHFRGRCARFRAVPVPNPPISNQEGSP